MPNTVISSSAMNSDLSDIASALTGSLARDGQGGMTAVLPLDPTGFNYTNDADTGTYRTGPNAQAIKVGGVDIVDITSSGIDVTGAITQNGIAILPPGLGPLPWAGTTAPGGWLLCYGQSLLRTSYVSLFAAIGTTYGSVDGTHFSLPDMRGRVPAGKDDMGGVAASRLTTAGSGVDGVTLGAVGGAQNIVLDATMIPPHVHPITDKLHDHGIATGVISGAGGIGATQPGPGNTTRSTQNFTGITSTDANIGGGQAHNNVQPTLITNYIIYAGV